MQLSFIFLLGKNLCDVLSGRLNDIQGCYEALAAQGAVTKPQIFTGSFR